MDRRVKPGGDDGANGAHQRMRTMQLTAIITDRSLRLALSVVCILFVPSLRSDAQSLNEPTLRLESLWEEPVPANMTPPLTLLELAQRSDGSAVLLIADRQGNKSLYVGANKSNPGQLVPLPALKSIPTYGLQLTLGLRLITGAAGQIWIGGTSNYREGLFGGRLSDGYLAKLEANGKLTWSRNFQVANGSEIHGLAALPDGDVVVLGTADNKPWLARISADAQIVWERCPSVRYIAAAAIIEDKIVVVGFDADGEAIWRFSYDGEPIDRWPIENIPGGGPQPLLFIKLFAAKDNEGFYALSIWGETLRPRDSLLAHPLKVVRFDARGGVIWRKELSQAILQGLDPLASSSNPRPNFCFPPIVGLAANGDPLVVCPERNTVLISQINSTTGEMKQMAAQRPRSSPCEEYRSWPSVTVPGYDNVIWLFGAGRCTWLDRIPLTQIRG